MKSSTTMRRRSHSLHDALKRTSRLTITAKVAQRRGRSYFLKMFSYVPSVEQNNYVQQVNAVLDVIKSDIDAETSLIKRQIILAMRSCNLRLVEIFLRAGSSTVTWRHDPTYRTSTECTDYDQWLNLIPAIVHACGQLKLDKCESLRDSKLSSRRMDNYKIYTPLQKMISVAVACRNGGIHCPLPTLTRMIIDAGGSLNGLGKNRFTAIHTLLLTARHMICTDTKYTTDAQRRVITEHLTDTHQMVMDTARMLIKARVERDASEDKVSLNILLNTDVLSDCSNFCLATWDSTFRLINLNVYPLYSKLTELLVAHQTHIMIQTPNRDHYKDLFSGVMEFLEANNLVRNLPIDKYNDIMDSMANMFRCRLLSGTDMHVADFFSSLPSSSDVTTFAQKFSLVAGYSAQPGRSNKFLRLFLDDALSLADVEKLEKLLAVRVKELNEMTEEKFRLEEDSRFLLLAHRSMFKESMTLDTARTFASSALESVRSVDKPRRLENLSRATVIKALVSGAVRSIASLSLPDQVKQYVLLNNY